MLSREHLDQMVKAEEEHFSRVSAQQEAEIARLTRLFEIRNLLETYLPNEHASHYKLCAEAIYALFEG